MGAFLAWQPAAGPSKSLFFDAVTTEGQQITAKATEHPVEDGPNVSDHIQKQLNRVTLEVFVSNSPVYDWNDRGAKLGKLPIQIEHYKAPFAPTPGAVFSAIGGAVSSAIGALLGKKEEYAASVLQFPSSFDAVSDTIAVLEKLQDDGQLVDVVLPSKLYESMFVESVAPTRNAGTGDGATIAISFSQIRKVEAKLVNAPKAAEVRGAVTKPKGAQSPKEVTDGKKKSILKSVTDAVKKRFAGSG